MIIVAQRVSTIADADQIVVLEDGRVVGVGRHAELLRDLPDIRRDRAVPARRGGAGMSDRSQEADASTAPRRERPKFAPPPGAPARPAAAARSAAASGMPAEKSLNFGPSAKRLLGRMSPERIGLICVVLLGVISVVLRRARPEDPGQRDQHHLRRRRRQAAAGGHHPAAGDGTRPGAGQRHLRQPAVRR